MTRAYERLKAMTDDRLALEREKAEQKVTDAWTAWSRVTSKAENDKAKAKTRAAERYLELVKSAQYTRSLPAYRAA